MRLFHPAASVSDALLNKVKNNLPFADLEQLLLIAAALFHRDG